LAILYLLRSQAARTVFILSAAFLFCMPAQAEEEISILVLSKFHPQTVTVETNTRIFSLEKNGNKPFVFSVATGEVMTVTVNAKTSNAVTRQYVGLISVNWSGEEFVIINTLDLESYVAGVVVGEMGASSHPEMKKVLSVLARTYALKRKQKISSKTEYHLSDLAYHQVYLGHSDAAVDALRETAKTAGQVLTHKKKLIDTVYHAECGRRFFSSREIWGYGDVVTLPDTPIDMPSPQPWLAELSINQIEEVFNTTLLPKKIVSDHAIQIVMGEQHFSVDEFRLSVNRKYGWNTLPSNDFDIEPAPNGYRFKGYGRGHLVGACQVQANQLTENGWSMSRILNLFYPNAEISTAY